MQPPASTARTSFIPAAPSSTSANPAHQAQTNPTTPELERTLAMLSSHRSVLGYILITRGQPYGVIRQSGVIFDGEQGKKYASAVAKMVEHVQHGLEEVREEEIDGASKVEPADEIRFLRIRTKRHEIMISPDERYILAVLHDPAT